MASLKLDINDWDLEVDNNGDIAITQDGAESIAQDVSSAVRVWLGEMFLDVNFGVPYRQILAHRPPENLIVALISEVAKTVDGVESIDVELDNYNPSRTLTGKININGAENVRF